MSRCLWEGDTQYYHVLWPLAACFTKLCLDLDGNQPCPSNGDLGPQSCTVCFRVSMSFEGWVGWSFFGLPLGQDVSHSDKGKLRECWKRRTTESGFEILLLGKSDISGDLQKFNFLVFLKQQLEQDRECLEWLSILFLIFEIGAIRLWRTGKPSYLHCLDTLRGLFSHLLAFCVCAPLWCGVEKEFSTMI